MDCTAPLFLETLIKRAVVVQSSTMCGTALIGGKDIGAVEAMDCVTSNKTWMELLYDALIEGDSVVGVDVIDGDTGDMERIDDCGPEGLETLFRRALILGATGTKVKVFRVPGSAVNCPDCDDPINNVPALTRIIGAFVRVGDETRVRVQNTGTLPEAANIDCDQTGISPLTLLAGALSYDASTKTWYWNTTEI